MQEDTLNQRQWRQYWPLLLIAGATLMLYGRTVGYGFLDWDDQHYIVENPVLRNSSLQSIARIFTPGAIADESLYIPISYLSFLPNSILFGLSPMVTHSINVLLHGLNGFLVFLLCRMLLKDKSAAAFAALLFVVHPLQVGTVSWAFCRRDLLAGTFALFSILAHLNWQTTRKYSFLALAVLLFVLGGLSKPNIIFLPLFFIALPWLKASPSIMRNWCPSLIYLVPMGAMIWVNTSIGVNESLNSQAQMHQLAFLPAVITQWFGRIFLVLSPSPYHLSSELTADLLHPLYILLPAIVVLALYVSCRTKRSVFIGLLFAGLCLAPSGKILLAANRQFYTADHYGYIAMMGFSVALIAALMSVRQVQLRFALMALIAVLASGLSHVQVGHWRDSWSMNQHALMLNPDNYLALTACGVTEIGRWDYVEAEKWLRRAVAVNIRHKTAWQNLCVVGQELNPADKERAYRHFQTAAHGWAYVTYLRATELRRNGKRDEALQLMEARLRQGKIDSTSPDFFFRLGTLYHDKNDLKSAARAYRKSVELSPRKLEARYNLGHVELNLGDYPAAIHEFRELVRLGSDKDAEAQLYLGISLISGGAAADSILPLEAALRLDSELHAAFEPLTAAYMATGQVAQAKAIAGRAQAAGITFNPGLTQLLQELSVSPQNSSHEIH